MNNYIYSAALNMICATALKADYEKSGTWPDDGLPLDDETAKEFMSAAPLGKVLAAGADSLPVWGDAPPLTEEEALAQAEQRKASLLNIAQETISIWQTKLLLGRISDEEKAQLNAWLDYIDVLILTDVTAAESVNWPVPPPAM